MTANSHTIPALAERLATLADAYKEDVASIIEDANEAEIDAGAIRRLASWKRMDPTKRAEREALDEQYRFLAGELAEPAALPAKGELAEAAALYGEGKTIRDVSAALKVSTGKAYQLKVKASAFSVHRKMNMNIAPAVEMTTDDLGEAGWAEGISLKRTPACNDPRPATWQGITVARDAFEAEREAAKEAERNRRRAEREALAAKNAVIDADPLDIPPFLRRVA